MHALSYQLYNQKCKLDSKELYKIQVLLKHIKPTSQHYFENHFSQSNIKTSIKYYLYMLLKQEIQRP